MKTTGHHKQEKYSTKQENLIITSKNDVIYYGYFSDGEPVELYCEKKEQESLIGNIYAAKVERVADGIGGAFLELGHGQKCYYRIPKNKKPIKLSSGHEDKLYGGDVILVQIIKDAVKTKLPVADENISFTGKYFVITLSDKRCALSKKIKEDEERKRLLNIVKPFQKEEYGLIIRTNAQGVSEEILQNELTILTRRYEELMRKAAFAPGQTLLFHEAPHYISFAQGLPRMSLEKIVTDQKDIFDELKEFYLTGGDTETYDKICFYEDPYPLEKLYRLEHFYEKALEKYVWLKSGGSLVIEPTEAMTVIDVNTGSFTKSRRQAEEIFFKMNCEAAMEIARQIRLRNLSGILLIDFINMKKQEEQEQLMRLLEKECGKDRIKTRVIDMTALNLVEMTRNKVRRPLHEQWKISHKKIIDNQFKR